MVVYAQPTRQLFETVKRCMSLSRSHHYVPQWYQRRFLSQTLGERKFYYLDKKPDLVRTESGREYTRNAIRRLGTKHCFEERDLYMLAFGKVATDAMEKEFFGQIDNIGPPAMEFFANYQLTNDSRVHFENVMHCINAQKFRTPKGLDWLKQFISSHQGALRLMRHIWDLHTTIWVESVWEIVECGKSETKFIISDNPVTTYNRKIFPGSKEGIYPRDARSELLGTHTIFPLDLDHCLVITNLGYARNPRTDPLRARENPRYFSPSFFQLGSIQTGREIPEKEVIAINYILKKRARRYIAAAHRDWLFPEKRLKSMVWNKLGGKFFLQPDPRKIPFTTEIVAQFTDGQTIKIDEYGRNPNRENRQVKSLRDHELKAWSARRKEWDKAFGPLTETEQQRVMRGF